MPAESLIPLFLFAKEPRPGHVKTRLNPPLTGAACASLATRMLEQTLEQACRHWPGKVVLCVTPDPHAPFFSRLAERYGVEVIAQQGRDLGERMQSALDTGIQRAGRAAVMGCDVPHCSPVALEQTHGWLESGHNVVGPTEDGGFYLLGLAEPPNTLFEGMTWGNSSVYGVVCQRALEREMRLLELPIERDIDTVADLEWLASVDAGYRAYLG